jgi:hypothetical protein
MATWKKIVVSGSDISQLNNDSQYLIQGQDGAILTGSFTGSFAGVATLPALGSGTGIESFSYNGSTAATVAVAGAAALSNNTITKWDTSTGTFINSSLVDNGTVVSGASSIQLTGANSSLTGSFTGSFTGDGSGLTGLVTELDFSGSIGSGTVDLLTQDFSILGTANQIVTTAANQTLTLSLPTDLVTPGSLTVTGDLTVNGTTTYLNTQDLFIEDQFILLASGSTTNVDGGFIIERGAYTSGSIAYGWDASTNRWGYQNGISGTDNLISFSTLTAGNATNAFAGYVFTEAVHGATKPTSGEFLKAGAIYTATNEDIWIYS